MAEELWINAVLFIAACAVVGFTYYLVQTAIYKYRSTMRIRQYLDCIEKISTFDWDKFPGEKPSASEVCKDLSSREKN